MRVASTDVNRNLIVKSGLGKVQSGDIFSVKIIKNSNGLIKALVRGKLIDVKSSRNLIPGQVLKVKADWKGNTLILKQIDSAVKIKTALEGMNVKPDQASIAMFRAAGKAGLVLKDDIIKIIKRFLRGRKKLSSEEAGAAAELLKKGLYPENMIQFITGGGEPDERHEQKKLLFNHLQDRDDLWFIIPFNFMHDGRSLDGSIRIQKRKITKKTEKAVIAVSDGDNKYYFLIECFTSAKRKIHVLTEGSPDEALKRGIKILLPEILGNMSVEIDDNIREKCFQSEAFDGFALNGDRSFGIEEFV